MTPAITATAFVPIWWIPFGLDILYIFRHCVSKSQMDDLRILAIVVSCRCNAGAKAARGQDEVRRAGIISSGPPLCFLFHVCSVSALPSPCPLGEEILADNLFSKWNRCLFWFLECVLGRFSSPPSRGSGRMHPRGGWKGEKNNKAQQSALGSANNHSLLP